MVCGGAPGPGFVVFRGLPALPPKLVDVARLGIGLKCGEKTRLAQDSRSLTLAVDRGEQGGDACGERGEPSDGAVTLNALMRVCVLPQIFSQVDDCRVQRLIVDFVRDNPGKTSGEIADVLVARGLALGAAEPRKTIQTVLGQLVSANRVRKDDEGRHYVDA